MSLIIMSKKVREFEIPTPTAEFSGHFKLEVINPSTGKVKRSLEFDNLILNNGLNRFNTGTSTSAVDRICIGTGTAVPDVNQTALSSFSASVVVSSTSRQSSSHSMTGTLHGNTFSRIRFAAGTLNGNYTELGVGWSNTQLFSRALIVDGLGNPTSITVLSDEALDVTYTIRSYVPQTDTTSTVTITGVGTDIPVTCRPALVQAGYNGGSGIFTSTLPWANGGSIGWTLSSTGVLYEAGSGMNTYAGGPGNYTAVASLRPTTAVSLQSMTTTSYTLAGSVTAVSDMSISTAAYVNNNFYKDTTWTLGLNAHNSTYRHFVVTFLGMGCYQFLLDTPITKTSSQILTLNFRCSWARRTI